MKTMTRITKEESYCTHQSDTSETDCQSRCQTKPSQQKCPASSPSTTMGKTIVNQSLSVISTKNIHIMSKSIHVSVLIPHANWVYFADTRQLLHNYNKHLRSGRVTS